MQQQRYASLGFEDVKENTKYHLLKPNPIVGERAGGRGSGLTVPQSLGPRMVMLCDSIWAGRWEDPESGNLPFLIRHAVSHRKCT